MKVKFWGVRGSVPTPLESSEIWGKTRNTLIKFIRQLECEKVEGLCFNNLYYLKALAESDRGSDRELLQRLISDWATEKLQLHECSTYGGNTTCVEVRCGDKLIIIDMGTGIRPLGQSLLSQMPLEATILMTHIHWDHIQGLPFFTPMYVPGNALHFYGGEDWQKNLEEVLKGQMDPPLFPVDFRQVQKTGAKMGFVSIHDKFSTAIPDSIKVEFRKLNHPNETYGCRVEYFEKGRKKVFVFATDTEPYPVRHHALLELAENADVLCVDAQYTQKQYEGTNSKNSRVGWGHGTPEFAASVAKEAGAKKLILVHHDPTSTDKNIYDIQEIARKIFPNTEAAYEGLELEI